MAAITVTCTKIAQDAQGRILISFGKRTREFASLADLRAFVADTLSRDVLEALFLKVAIDRQADLSSPQALEGHSLTADTSLANVVRLS